jgi:adenylate cyclase class IV
MQKQEIFLNEERQERNGKSFLESIEGLNMSESEKKMGHFEIENKYRVDPSIELPFVMLVRSFPEEKTFIHAEGADKYYVKDGNKFCRYRRQEDSSRAELTYKIKPKDAINNIVRVEYNIRVDGTPPEVIDKVLTEIEGYKHSFTIYKRCSIFNFSDAIIVYYSVADITDGKVRGLDHFIEIEVNEEILHNLTEAEARAILDKYEKKLEPIGISPYKRLRKSLWEMYKRD